jgi:hypothetical protein
VRFDVEQRFNADPDRIIAIYTDPAFYPRLAGLTKIGEPEVLDVVRAGDRVTMRVRFRFTAPLPAAATAVLDPERLTWIDVSVYDLAARTSTTRLLPDHYPDRMTATAQSRFVELPAGSSGTSGAAGTRRSISGELKVRMPLVGGRVEATIVGDLRTHLGDEARLVNEQLATS